MPKFDELGKDFTHVLFAASIVFCNLNIQLNYLVSTNHKNCLFFRIMAPTKDFKKKSQQFMKESYLFKHCKKGAIDPAYMSLHACERNFGFKFSDLSLEEMKEVVWGVRCGQQGYFISPEVDIFNHKTIITHLFRLLVQ